MCTFIARFLMSYIEAVRRAPCIFYPIWILDVEKCKRICLPPFVTLILFEGIVLIWLSNLRTRFFLRGVG
jgi:hypothetical protein